MQDIASNMQFQLHRMRVLFTLEAQEYERGRSLQVLQPSQTPMLRTNVQLADSSALASDQHADTSGSGNGTSEVAVTAQSQQAGVAVTASAQQAPGDPAYQPAHQLQQEAFVTVPTAQPFSSNAPATLSTPAAGSNCATMPRFQSPPVGQLNLPPVLQQNNPTASTPASAVAADVTSQPISLPCSAAGPACSLSQPAVTPAVQLPSVEPAVQIIPPLLLQQTTSAPLMQQVLQKQQQWSPPPPRNGQQPSSNKERNGKRAGHCIEPEALKRMVERQLQMQREKQQEAQQWQQQQAEQEVSGLTSQQQRHLQHQQQSQRLHPQQQHRQRCMTRLPEQYRQHVQQQTSSAAAHPSSSITEPLTIVALQLQPPEPLESPGACLGLNLPLNGFDNALGLDLDSSKLFGSAQKRLRLSLCDEGHSGGLLSPPAAATTTNLHLSEALVSPVFHAGALSGGLETPTMPAASQVLTKEAALEAAAVSAALLEPSDMPTPSKFFVNSPAAVLALAAAAATPRPEGALYCTPITGVSTAAAAATGKETATATAGAPPLPSPAFATASRLFVDSSPVVIGGSAAAAAATAAGVGLSEAPVTITPSKYLNCSPVPAADKQPVSRLVRDTPMTPVLFGQTSSPVWARMTDRQQQQQQLVSSSNPLRTARRSSTDAAARLSSWVPVTDSKQGIQLPIGTPSAAATESTPMNGHVPVALFQTPPAATAAAASTSGGLTGDATLDPAAAAAVPVDIDAFRRKKRPTAAAADEVENVPVRPVGVAAGDKGSAAAEKRSAAAEAPIAIATGGNRAVLLTPPVVEQQVTATPLTQVV